MNKTLCLVVVAVFGFSGIRLGYAAEKDVKNLKLDYCKEKSLGIKFKCDKDWEIQTIKDAVLVVISSEPDVTLIIAKIDSRIKFLSQLTKDFLSSKDRYAPGFRLENINFVDRKALKVKAFAKNNKDKRILDYYFLNNSVLYGILFSVNPKEDTSQFKFLFKQIIDDFKFIE